MNWDNIYSNIDEIAASVAAAAGVAPSARIADTVRDSATAIKANKAHELTGLDKACADAIYAFDAEPEPEPEPVKPAPKTKK